MTQPNYAVIERLNQSNLKAVKSGAKIRYLFTMAGRNALLLIGNGHDKNVVDVVSKSQHFSGEIEVLRERLIGKGELKVTGCKGRKAEFETAMARFTKKQVFHV